MALLFCDGFDDGLLTTKWAVTNVTAVAAAGRNGTSGAYFDASGDALRRTLSPAVSTIFVGLAFKVASVGGQGGIFSLWSDLGANRQLTVTLEPSGQLAVRRGSYNGTIIINSSVALTANVWHFVELKATLADAGGILELRIDGKNPVTFTGDTRNTGSATTFDGVVVEPIVSTDDRWVDDVYICDATGSVNNDFLGDIRIETLYPNGNGTNSQLMGSDSNQVDNYLLVDEAGTPVTTDYVSSGVVGEKDTYNFTNLTVASGPVKGVQISSHAVKTDAGSRSVKVLALSGGITAAGTAVPLQTTYNTQTRVQETDPNGGGAWTIAAVNAAEFGAEVDA